MSSFFSFQKSYFPFLLAALAAFFGYTSNVNAESAPFKNDAEGMTLSPPSFEMTLEPGTETAYTIRITNPTKNLVELYPSAGNFSASGEGGEPKYEIGDKAIENDSRYSIASWVGFFEPKIAILPEQVVEFRFRIKVPENAEPGGHYGVVFLGTKPPEDKSPESQVALSTMVGSLLLVRVPGDVHEEANIDEFSIPWFFFSPPIDFIVYLKNIGNVHVRPRGDITVLNWRGREETRIDINPAKGSILPESRRKFDTLWNPEAKYFWEMPIGRFYATLKIDYGEDHQELSRTVIFWIIPKWLIIAVSILFLLIIIFIIFFIIQRKRRRQALQRRNGGFFPAFKNPPFEIEGAIESKMQKTTTPTEQQKLHDQESSSNQRMHSSSLLKEKDPPSENSSVRRRVYDSSVSNPIQKICDINKQSKRFQRNQMTHSSQEIPQKTSEKSKGRRFI